MDLLLDKYPHWNDQRLHDYYTFIEAICAPTITCWNRGTKLINVVALECVS